MLVAYKGLYVDNFAMKLGDNDAENALLTYAMNNGFTTLSLYDIQKILKKGNIDQDTTQALANFISKARTDYKVLHIAGIAENADFFTNVISRYNQVRNNAVEMIDVYNLEFEFWNQEEIDNNYCEDYLDSAGIDCNTDGAYSFYNAQLAFIHQLAKNDGCVCETYVGWPNETQANGMKPNFDRILIHAYVTDPASAYGYALDRLQYYAENDPVSIIIIFSSEPDFSGPWLAGRNEGDAYTAFLDAYNADPQPWKSNIKLLGYQWFDYGNMLPLS
jgi:hypothetical protein